MSANESFTRTAQEHDRSYRFGEDSPKPSIREWHATRESLDALIGYAEFSTLRESDDNYTLGMSVLDLLSSTLDASKDSYRHNSDTRPPFYWSVSSNGEAWLYATLDLFMKVEITQKKDGSFRMNIDNVGNAQSSHISAPISSMDIAIQKNLPSTVDIHFNATHYTEMFKECRRHLPVMSNVYKALLDRIQWYKDDKLSFQEARISAWNRRTKDQTRISDEILEYITQTYVQEKLPSVELNQFLHAVDMGPHGSLRALAKAQAIEDMRSKSKHIFQKLHPIPPHTIEELKNKLREAGFNADGRKEMRMGENQEKLLEDKEMRKELSTIWTWLMEKALDADQRRLFEEQYGTYRHDLYFDAIHQALVRIRKSA